MSWKGLFYLIISVLFCIAPAFPFLSCKGSIKSSAKDQKIVFTSDRDGNAEIYIMDGDGKNQKRLTYDNGYDDYASFSPDGGKIVFASGRDGNLEIYIMDSDGKNQKRLTFNDSDDIYPSFSPDDKKIVFCTNRDGNWEIYEMNIDGTNAQNLTNNIYDDKYPSYSPDGRFMVFASVRDYWIPELYILDIESKKVERLTRNSLSIAIQNFLLMEKNCIYRLF
jgi:TolB protein